jgi:hypothetical protein
MTAIRRDGSDTPFSAWLRAHPALDSIKERLSVSDCDYWIHQYRAHRDRVGSRAVDSIMLVELKTFCADVGYAQRDTLHLVHQLLRHASVRPDGRRRTLRLDGQKAGERRIVRCFGVHTLRISSDRPDRSSLMYWDGRVIDEQTLVEILSFLRDPDAPMRSLSTERRHHAPHPVMSRQLHLIDVAHA